MMVDAKGLGTRRINTQSLIMAIFPLAWFTVCTGLYMRVSEANETVTKPFRVGEEGRWAKDRLKNFLKIIS
jgi:hypothetical protein